MNSNMELFNNFALMEGFNTTNIHEGFSNHLQSQLPNDPIFDPMAHFFPSSSGCNNLNLALEPEIHVNSSLSASIMGADKVKKKQQLQGYGGKKRKRVSEKEMEIKPREIVHVRAKRGQATDSHSLAERLRREKINEKLRCLQDLVPGCYKTMGMAVMLDVIISYVGSLQNQIDFLSMKLSAASLYYDFNSSEAEAMEAIRRYQTQGMEKVLLMGDGFGGNSQFQAPNWPI